MSRSARTVTTLLLCVVLLGALVFAIVSHPDEPPPSRPIAVDLDFDTFQPGVVQTRTTPMHVPVRSQVRRAGMLRSTGDTADIDWTFELCRDSCVPHPRGRLRRGTG